MFLLQTESVEAIKCKCVLNNGDIRSFKYTGDNCSNVLGNGGIPDNASCSEVSADLNFDIGLTLGNDQNFISQKLEQELD